MRSSPLTILCCLLLLAASGCSSKPEPKQSIAQAQTKFELKCQKDFDLHVITKLVGQTLWIYLPTQDPIFDYEASKENSAEQKQQPTKYAVQFVDGHFKDGQFALEYDIIDRIKVKVEDYGYNSSYTDSYIKAQNNLFTAVHDVFFNAEAKTNETEPLFFVIVITDIKKGIETRATFYLDDFKRYMSGDLPYDEYMKRFIADTKGGESMIGDEIGSHLKYADITMTDFLVKQMINRINFKFQRSDFPPADDYDNTIAGIIADTARYYKFEDFNSAQLTNLRQRKKLLFDKNDLASFGDDSTSQFPAQGKLIKIRFENGEPQFIEEENAETPQSP